MSSSGNDLKQYLDASFFDRLDNLQIHNPKILVIFSGGNGVGKSSLAQCLQDEFQGLLLENDAIRELLIDRDSSLKNDRECMGQLVWDYAQGLYRRLLELSPNGLVIRDAVIDWSFEKILPTFLDQGYELFVVRFELSREKRREMLQKRGGKAWISAALLEGQFEKHEKHAKRFLSEYTPDVTLYDESVFDYEKVVDALRIRINNCSER